MRGEERKGDGSETPAGRRQCVMIIRGFLSTAKLSLVTVVSHPGRAPVALAARRGGGGALAWAGTALHRPAVTSVRGAHIAEQV